jgi:hypothetical protein
MMIVFSRSSWGPGILLHALGVAFGLPDRPGVNCEVLGGLL